jgi:formylglycine-generating enzyme
MKIQVKCAAILMFATALTFAGCDGGGSNGGGSGIKYSAGDQETYTADGVSFVMSYVPGGLTFPTGTNDEDTATVANAYWIGETEVTYELWKKVYDWATDAARGANIYTFANAGTMGDGSGDTPQHPVTTVNWRDSMVWCNAATEWYNANNSTSYECVYTYSSAVIRDSRDSNATACDGAVASTTAKGFRLLSSNEWECAARYRDGTQWTYGDHASGDNSGACYNDGSILGGLGMSTVFDNYAVYLVYLVNSGSSTAAVKSKTANALDLYDMSGNAWEWCFDLRGSLRVTRGGSWLITAGSMQVGYWHVDDPYYEFLSIGFRFARTE